MWDGAGLVFMGLGAVPTVPGDSVYSYVAEGL